MRFRSCFLLSSFLVFGYPLAVRKAGNSDGLHNLDETLAIRNDADVSKSSTATPLRSSTSNAGNVFDQPWADKAQPLSTQNQSPSKGSTGLSGLGPSTGSSLIADGITDELGAWGSGATGTAGAVGAAALDLLWGRINDVNLLLDDNPKDVKVINPFTPFKKDDGAKNGGIEVQGTTLTNQGGAGAASEGGGTGTTTEPPCPREKFGLRNLAWCDLGYPPSVAIRGGYEIVVRGYRCTLFPHCYSQSSRPSSFTFYVVININKLYCNPPADLGYCLGAYQLYWCCEALDSNDASVSERERERKN